MPSPEVRQLASVLSLRMGSRKSPAVITWAKIVNLKQQRYFPSEFAALVAFYEYHSKFFGTLEFKRALADYHARGFGVVHVYDDLAVLLSGE